MTSSEPLRRPGAMALGRPPEAFDPFGPGFQSDPYPAYARYRTLDPVHPGLAPIPSMPRCRYVFRYHDVVDALRNPALGRERPGREGGSVPGGASTAIRRAVRSMMLFVDPPRHTRIRKLVARGFSRELHRHAAERVRSLAHDLVQRALGEDVGAVDFMDAIAVPLPVLAMADFMGLPAGDRDRIKTWSTDMVALTDVRQDTERMARAACAAEEVTDYLRTILAWRRKEPGDDLLSALLAAEVDGGRLREREILANALLLLSAGHETSVNMLGNGILALLRNPDEALRLNRDPSLATPAVEECLRYDSPVQMTFRMVQEDAEVGGVPVERGEALALVIGAANRDPERFDEPDRFDVGRRANRHLAFGAGVHHCIGSTLGRMEGRMALEALAPLLPLLELTDAEVTMGDNLLFRGPVRVEVRRRGGHGAPGRVSLPQAG